MATVNKVLGQSKPVAKTLSLLYTVPSATATVCSTLAICNQGGATKFRIAVCPSGETIQEKHYIVYDAALTVGDSTFLTLGLTLAATDRVLVYAEDATVSFSLFGAEIN